MKSMRLALLPLALLLAGCPFRPPAEHDSSSSSSGSAGSGASTGSTGSGSSTSSSTGSSSTSSSSSSGTSTGSSGSSGTSGACTSGSPLGAACGAQTPCCTGLTCSEDGGPGWCCLVDGPCLSDDCCGAVPTTHPDGENVSICRNGWCSAQHCIPVGGPCGSCCLHATCDASSNTCRLPDGDTCTDASQCHTGSDCVGGFCAPAPICHGYGSACTSDADCCSGYSCVSGTCSSGPTCVAQVGGACGGIDGPSCCGGMGCAINNSIGYCCILGSAPCATDEDCCGSAPYDNTRTVCGTNGQCTYEFGNGCAGLGGDCSGITCCPGMTCQAGPDAGSRCCDSAGSPCATDAACCSGLCSPDAGCVEPDAGP